MCVCADGEAGAVAVGWLAPRGRLKSAAARGRTVSIGAPRGGGRRQNRCGRRRRHPINTAWIGETDTDTDINADTDTDTDTGTNTHRYRKPSRIHAFTGEAVTQV